MTRIRRRIKIEVDGYPEPLYLNMNFKGDVSDKIDPGMPSYFFSYSSF